MPYDRNGLKPSYLTPEQACELMRMSPESMMELVESGQIHFPATREDGTRFTTLFLFQGEAEAAGLFGTPDELFQ
jgi:hypothetical protein